MRITPEDIVNAPHSYESANQRGGRVCDCPACGLDKAQPMTWVEVDDSHWHVNMWCPDCGDDREVVLSLAEVEEYNQALAEGVKQDANTLGRINEREYIACFAGALSVDAILPEDFGRPR